MLNSLLCQLMIIAKMLLLYQFAMGLNMPAKTVVFTAVKKWDGDSHRYIGSGEYIQVGGSLLILVVILMKWHKMTL